MSNIAVGVIANRIVLRVSDGASYTIMEMSHSEAVDVSDCLITALVEAANGDGMADSFQQFLEWF